jgi:hypothetical protein
MPATVFEQHYRDRIQSGRQIAQRFDADHAAGSGFVSLDLATLCSELADAGQRFLELEFKRIFKEPDITVAWLRERRRVIEELTDSFLEFANSLKNSVSQASQTTDASTEKDNVDRIKQAIQRVVAARQSVLQRWPVGSDQEIAEARAGGPKEDYLDPDEAFAQIAGVDVETWRQRMAKHRSVFPHQTR